MFILISRVFLLSGLKKMTVSTNLHFLISQRIISGL